MQPAAAPKLLRALRFVEIALREPRRTHDDLALARAVVRYVIHLRIDDAQLHERDRAPRPAQNGKAPLRVSGQELRREVREREDRAGLRHPIAGNEVDALVDCRAGERQGQRGATDHDLPAAQVPFAQPRAREQHLQDRRYAVREGDTFARDEAEQHVRHVASRIDLFHAEQRRNVRQAPRVDVEHRRDRHVDVARTKRCVRRVSEGLRNAPACAARAGDGCSRRPSAAPWSRSCRT